MASRSEHWTRGYFLILSIYYFNIKTTFAWSWMPLTLCIRWKDGKKILNFKLKEKGKKT